MKKMILILLGMATLIQGASAACIYGKIVPVQEEGNFLVDAKHSMNVIGAVTDLAGLPMNKAEYFEYKYIPTNDENVVLVTVKIVSSCSESEE